MMRRSISAVAAAGVALAALVPAVAADAAAPAWRTVQSNAKADYFGVAAVNSKNVWVVGRVSAKPHAWRFDGKRWIDTKLPTAFQKNTLLYTVAGSASNNVWVFAAHGASTYALRWNGSKWTVAHAWKSTWEVGGAVVNGPKDVWVHGSENGGFKFGTWHYNGRSWSRVKPGFRMAAGASVSSKNMWAVGDNGAAKPSPVARHWNGKSLSTVKLPALPVVGGHPAELRTVAARSSSDVWIAGARYVNPANYATLPMALHFDGKSWRRFDPPTKNDIVSMAQDGKGGVWAATYSELFHVTKGHWAKVALPTVKGKATRVGQLSHVPGGTSVWATGRFVWDGADTSTGAIFRY
ncbi:hypothetical protein [Actinomadura harenae]|uniref:Uncharacterized protein n=1 Tax=Actinomadura harenae TaxID=2483351 RepID=A0A3M2MDP6_9ACTN|nr:hypothetical protein [Actinomadura harenae]RMI47672.1 hypothetical protein EBO15_01900 [Actinomadura harenae]